VAGQPPEQQGTTEGDELDEQDDLDQLAAAELELLGAIDA